MPRFLYMESAPALQGKARDFGASYRRMAVVEIDPAKLPPGRDRPSMISERAKGVVRIVTEDVASVGSTNRSYGYRFRQECLALVTKLNSGNGNG